MKKTLTQLISIPFLTITLFFIAGSASADAWPAWKGDEYYNDTFTDPFNQMHWTKDFSGTDTYTFNGGTVDHSLAGKWVNLVLSEDVSIFVLRAVADSNVDGNFTVNLDMNGKNLTSESSKNTKVFWDGGPNADPGAVLNVTNSSETTSVLTWNALCIGRVINTMGTINVSGPNTSLSVPTNPQIGLGGKGVLNVTGGAKFDVASTLLVGVSESGTGEINVSGSGSTVTSAATWAWTDGEGVITVKDGATWNSSLVRVGVLDNPGYGTVLISGANSIFSASYFQINRGTVTVADGGHLEAWSVSSATNIHTVSSNGTVRLDNGTAEFNGRWNLKRKATLEFVLKDARETPFITINDQPLDIAPDASVTFEMGPDPELRVNDFIPLAHFKNCVGTFEGYPEGHEFSLPYRNYEYTFRINYNIEDGGDRTMGLTVLETPPSGFLMIIR